MSDLPDGWLRLKGVSGGGWDIWLGSGYKIGQKPFYAIWWRLISFETQDPYKMGKTYTSTKAADDAYNELRKEFLNEGWSIEDWKDPFEAMKASPGFGRF